MTSRFSCQGLHAETGRVLIGIPAYAHACDALLGKDSAAVPNTYIDALVQVGASPLIIPVVADQNLLAHLTHLLDGLMLIGGPDVDPAHYGEAAHPGLRQMTPSRDRMELLLTAWALQAQMPILAICRGIQVLNVAAGGRLWQDIASQVPNARKHDQHPEYREDHLAHPIQITPGSRLAAICRQTRIHVNSLHHQAISQIGQGLAVVARADDGIIEAVESSGAQWVVGVQWHPEWLVARSEAMLALFRAFREACQSRPVATDPPDPRQG